jgi:hypothetical protein
MKKIFSIVLLLSFLAVLIVPMMALAQPSDQCTIRNDLSSFDTACILANNPINETDTKAWGMCCILDALYTATNWIFIVLMVIVGLFIIFGGLTIVTAGGSPEKVTAGKNYILYALIGLALALLSKALPSVVKALLGV